MTKNAIKVIPMDDHNDANSIANDVRNTIRNTIRNSNSIDDDFKDSFETLRLIRKCVNVTRLMRQDDWINQMD